MDSLQGFNQAMDYIEAHLLGGIEWEAVARRAGCTLYTFSTMFAYLSGISLNEYVRRRRLTQAAAMLRVPGTRVLDVALACGYESPTAFTRAFSAQHGITPREAMRGGAKLKSFSAVSFQLTIKGAENMEYQMEQKGAMRMVGKKWKVSMVDGENFRTIPQIWKAEMENGRVQQYDALTGEVIGACTETGSDEFHYWIGKLTNSPVPEGMEARDIPAAQWAVFPCTMETLQDVTRRIFSQWLPGSGYELAPLPQLEVYKAEHVEIWVAVTEKKAVL